MNIYRRLGEFSGGGDPLRDGRSFNPLFVGMEGFKSLPLVQMAFAPVNARRALKIPRRRRSLGLLVFLWKENRSRQLHKSSQIC